MSGFASSLSVLVGLALGIAFRVLMERSLGDTRRAAILWPVELGIAFVLGALTGIPLVASPGRFAAIGGALGIGLSAYAVTSGALAFSGRDPPAPITVPRVRALHCGVHRRIDGAFAGGSGRALPLTAAPPRP